MKILNAEVGVWADPTTPVAQTSAWLDSAPSYPISAWANSAPRFGPNLAWAVVIQTLGLAWADSTPSLSPTHGSPQTFRDVYLGRITTKAHGSRNTFRERL